MLISRLTSEFLVLGQREYLFVGLVDSTNLSLQHVCLKVLSLSIIAGVFNSNKILSVIAFFFFSSILTKYSV